MTIILTIGAVLVFTVFDVFGFHFWYLKERNKRRLRAYRIAQGSFQTAITIALIFYFLNPLAAVYFNFLWWMGVCDLLYFVFLRMDYRKKYTNLHWLWWTPYGLALGKDRIEPRHLTNYSIIGAGLVGLAAVFFYGCGIDANGWMLGLFE